MKAIAAAGVAIGGASVLQDGNVVYAAELDQGLEGEELVLPAEEEISEEQTAQDSTSDAGSAGESDSAEVSGSEEIVESTEGSESVEESGSIGNEWYVRNQMVLHWNLIWT